MVTMLQNGYFFYENSSYLNISESKSEDYKWVKYHSMGSAGFANSQASLREKQGFYLERVVAEGEINV